MKVHFLGLSCFLIENRRGFRILVDPFNDAPEWRLGPRFPATFKGKPFGANLVLMSEPDADHAFAPGDWLTHAPPTRPRSNPFPGLQLRGTVVHEYNGDVNIAWQYTVDGIRLAHFADLAHRLTSQQLKEIGRPDVIFLSPPKAPPDNDEALNIVRFNITQLKPKIVFWAHHLAPEGLPLDDKPDVLRNFFSRYFRANAWTNKNYRNAKSFLELWYVLENAIQLNREYSGLTLNRPAYVIGVAQLRQGTKKPVGILFRSMLSRSR